MKHLLVALSLLPAVLGAQSDTSKLRWVPNPRVANGGWVSDPANHLRAETRAQMDSAISALERETSAEIAVAVVDSLDGLEPADAALLLHRRWGVGKRERDNGIVLLWSPALRKIYVSVGYGLEGVLPDSRAGRIQDQAMLPAFRRNNFDAGMLGGVRALATAAREETYSGLPRAKSQRDGDSKVGFFGLMAIALSTVVGGFIWLVTGRYPRRCPNGHGFMRRLSEQADNAKLGVSQQLEEKMGSVDYDVWVCDRCDATKVVQHGRLFSAIEVCPKCKRRAVKKTSRKLVEPTYSSSGSREISKSCKNCGDSRQYKETIAKLQHSTSGSSSGGSSSGGGGGSSFGGGSAGGGGAGRSY